MPEPKSLIPTKREAAQAGAVASLTALLVGGGAWVLPVARGEDRPLSKQAEFVAVTKDISSINERMTTAMLDDAKDNANIRRDLNALSDDVRAINIKIDKMAELLYRIDGRLGGSEVSGIAP